MFAVACVSYSVLHLPAHVWSYLCRAV